LLPSSSGDGQRPALTPHLPILKMKVTKREAGLSPLSPWVMSRRNALSILDLQVLVNTKDSKKSARTCLAVRFPCAQTHVLLRRRLSAAGTTLLP